MLGGKGFKRSWGSRRKRSSRSHEISYQKDISEQSTCSYSSHESSFQHNFHISQQPTYSQQTTSSQQATSSQDVSTEQPILASYENSKPRAKLKTIRGTRPLKVYDSIFCPHDAVRDVTLAFKKSFTGSWHCWSVVPQHVRDQWFNEFKKKYSFLNEDKVLIRKTFDRVGSERLSGNLGKAKRDFSRTKKVPKWISQIHWDGLMHYWNSDDFKQISAINSRNRKASNNGEGPSLHTGGSVAFAEYRRRHRELTGQDLRNDELFLKTHQRKDEQWVCEKSKRTWNAFTNIIKKKVDDDGTEINITTNGEEGGEHVENLLKTIPDEQVLDAWIEATGGAKNGRIYGLGFKYLPRELFPANSSSSHASTSSGLTQKMFETPDFEQLLDRVLEQRIKDIETNMHACIREAMGEEVEAAVRAVVGRTFGFHQ